MGQFRHLSNAIQKEAGIPEVASSTEVTWLECIFPFPLEPCSLEVGKVVRACLCKCIFSLDVTGLQFESNFPQPE